MKRIFCCTSFARYERRPEFTGHSSQAALCDSIWEIEQHPPILESSLGVFVGVLSSWIWDVARTYFKPDLGSFHISIASVAGVWKGREREFKVREKRERRAPRVSLAPKIPFPFPFKRLPRRLFCKQFPLNFFFKIKWRKTFTSKLFRWSAHKGRKVFPGVKIVGTVQRDANWKNSQGEG